MIPQPGKDVPWGELHVGSRSIFAAAGFAEVNRLTLRRAVMRIDSNRGPGDIPELAQASRLGLDARQVRSSRVTKRDQRRA